MSETVEIYRAMGEHKKRLRAKYGQPCPQCVQKLPKAHPSILLPGQTFRIHRFKDMRPDLTDEQWSEA